jgi:hypothetical protein
LSSDGETERERESLIFQENLAFDPPRLAYE